MDIITSNTRIKLKLEEPQDIRKISHHKNLLNLLFFEKKLNVNKREIINNDEYVIKPASDNGIAVLLRYSSVPHELFKTISQPLLVKQNLDELNNPNLSNVIVAVSTIPIVLNIDIRTFGSLNSFIVLLFKVFKLI